MNDPDDPFLITSRLQIAALLRNMARKNVLLHMRMAEHGQALITTLLDVDPDHNALVVDAASDEAFNERIGRTQAVHFDATVERVKVQFSVAGPASAQLFDARAAFRLPFPEALRRIQRRDHYRIDIPVTHPLVCAIPTPSQGTVALRAKDISAGGIALLDPASELDTTAGTRYPDCELHLSDTETLAVGLAVRRVSMETVSDARPTRVIACQFLGLQGPGHIAVQHYIGRLERMLNARRRGFD